MKAVVAGYMRHPELSLLTILRRVSAGKPSNLGKEMRLGGMFVGRFKAKPEAREGTVEEEEEEEEEEEAIVSDYCL
jgi:hypothetical protein